MNKALRTTPIRGRGIAMVLVLMVVALASAMAWAVVASSNVGTQVSAAATNQVQRKYLAESGLQLAMYYLQNPEASPVGLVYGPWGNVHYPGESNVQLGDMPGRVDVTVTNTANGVFAISSTANLDGDTQTASAVVHLEKHKAFSQAANFVSNVSMGSNINISGGLLTVGNLINTTATIVGDVITRDTAPGSTLPEGTLTRYPLSMTHYLPYYFVDGKRYTAKRLTSTTVLVTLLDLDLINNPYNVWYTNQDVTFYLTTILSGTIVTTNGKNITVAGTLTVNPRNKLPALVSDNNLVISGNLRTLTLNGPTFVKNQIRGTGTTTSSKVKINGVLVSPVSGPLLNAFNGTVDIVFDPEKATFKSVMDEVEPIHAITVRAWTTNDRSF